MDIGWGAGVGVNGTVGTSLGASVGARVGRLVGAAVAASRIGFVVAGAGLQLLRTIKLAVSKTPSLMKNVFTFASIYAFTACFMVWKTFATNRSLVFSFCLG